MSSMFALTKATKPMIEPSWPTIATTTITPFTRRPRRLPLEKAARVICSKSMRPSSPPPPGSPGGGAEGKGPCPGTKGPPVPAPNGPFAGFAGPAPKGPFAGSAAAKGPP